MSQQALDLRRSVQTVRRHKILVGIMAALGLLAGAAYVVLHPPQLSSTALVILPNSAPSTSTQVVIAESEPVLSAALPMIHPPVSLAELSHEIHVKSVTSYILSFSAHGKTAGAAEATANAVAASYVAYVGLKYSLVGHVVARVLEPATTAAGPGLPLALVSTGLIGALVGALIGVIVALAISRGDRRLWERDDIANSIGVPVLAAVSVDRPSDAAGWTRLLEEYKPGAVDAWQLRTALRQLGITGTTADNGVGVSIAVLTFSSDAKALALGPQLAVFAASQGIATVLALSSQQDPNVTAALRTACAMPASGPSRRLGHLQIAVATDEGIDRLPDAELIIAIAVIDADKPEIARAVRANATVLGVSAAAATAEQLARAAVVAAADGREMSGILVADPEPTDRSSGRLPRSRPSQPARRRQARSAGITTEIRR
jgi:capsular polysaccharide biosynthesis protein